MPLRPVETALMQQELIQLIPDLIRKAAASPLAKEPDRNAEIVMLYFGFLGGDADTLEKVGDFYGLSRTRTGEIVHTVLLKLKQPLIKKELEPYLRIFD